MTPQAYRAYQDYQQALNDRDAADAGAQTDGTENAIITAYENRPDDDLPD